MQVVIAEMEKKAEILAVQARVRRAQPSVPLCLAVPRRATLCYTPLPFPTPVRWSHWSVVLVKEGQRVGPHRRRSSHGTLQKKWKPRAGPSASNH